MHDAASPVCRDALRASWGSCTQRWPAWWWDSEGTVVDVEAFAGVGEPTEMLVAPDLFGEVAAEQHDAIGSGGSLPFEQVVVGQVREDVAENGVHLSIEERCKSEDRPAEFDFVGFTALEFFDHQAISRVAVMRSSSSTRSLLWRAA